MINLLDTENEFNTWFEKFVDWSTPLIIGLLEILVIIFIARKLSVYFVKLISRAMEVQKVDKGVQSFVCSLTRILIAIIAILLILTIAGVSTASFATAIGASGLAIGLAFQGTLQNLAGGLLILIMKPFEVGNYIATGGYEGTVISIDICYTKLRTLDNRIVNLPNGGLANSNLVNFSKEPFRRVDIELPVSYSDDIKALKEMVKGVIAEDKRICTDPAYDIIVTEFGNDSVVMYVRVWVANANYWSVKWDLTERLKYGMDANGFTIPFRQVDLHVKEDIGISSK